MNSYILSWLYYQSHETVILICLVRVQGFFPKEETRRAERRIAKKGLLLKENYYPFGKRCLSFLSANLPAIVLSFFFIFLFIFLIHH